ncbi:hypothetical protein NKR23_g4015 [Pleurostoma richardsiae]|uniref:Uncharacterized protein n=1 Tax=Pleurostoma richardsiae TaxID=41990 RepID=A0AA38VL64_9PEZI|nr:hypothetical protein NKR23_g4015 [Pleurostoma richardsiae]
MALFGEKKQRTYCHRCGDRVKKLNYRGQILRSKYCGRCFCKKIEDGRTCQWPRVNLVIPWCAEHLRCQAGGIDGGRCDRAVKENNPEKYKFCADTHNCAQSDCVYARLPDRPYCAEHLCSSPGCRDPRRGGPYPFCLKHTCQHLYCTSVVPGDSDPSSPWRFCETHRRCSRNGCSRRCHMRDSGSAANFCGEHYCQWVDGCGEERAAGAEGHWGRHRCKEAGCARGIAAYEGWYCREHECDMMECRYPKLVGDYCHSHTCQRRNCKKEARMDGFCDNHQRCEVPGCKEDRLVEGMKKHDRCDRHRHGSCQAGGIRPCSNRVVEGTHYCEDHLCGFRLCGNAKLFGCSYCEAHKCPVANCQELRQSAGVAYGGRRMTTTMGFQPLVAGYCAQHSCRHGGCDSQAMRDQFFCAVHKCSTHGCMSEGTNSARGGSAACDAHYRGQGSSQGFFSHFQPLPQFAPRPAFPFANDDFQGSFGSPDDFRPVGFDPLLR